MACQTCPHPWKCRRTEGQQLVLPALGEFHPEFIEPDRRNSSRRWQERNPLQIRPATTREADSNGVTLIRQAHPTEIVLGISTEVCANPQLHTWIRPVVVVQAACPRQFAEAIPVHAVLA